MSEKNDETSNKPRLSLVPSQPSDTLPTISLERQIFNFIATVRNFTNWIKPSPGYKGALKKLAPAFKQACAPYLPLPDTNEAMISQFFDALKNLNNKSLTYIGALNREITNVNCGLATGSLQSNTQDLPEKLTQKYKDKAVPVILTMRDIYNILQHDDYSRIIPTHLDDNSDDDIAKYIAKHKATYQNFINHGINTKFTNSASLETAQSDHKDAFDRFTCSTAQLAAHGPFKSWQKISGNNNNAKIVSINNASKPYDTTLTDTVEMALSILSSLYWPKLRLKGDDNKISLFEANFSPSKREPEQKLSLVT